MACTCRAPARCPVCNTQVRVPLSYLDGMTAQGVRGGRLVHREGSSAREGLRRLIEGSSTCPSCGQLVRFEHSRSCVSNALASVGVPLPDRASILARIVFPEG